MTEKVLLVDDDPNLLDALRRQFRKRFDLMTAEGGDAALDCFGNGTTVAVAVVDMRMPGMDGLQLLRRIREVSPDTVRIMLTGNADQQTAVDAINQGSIFRFFGKPCDPDILAEGIEAGISQYRLITAEHELLEHTLAGSVKVLVDVLAMIDPVGFGRSDRVREWAYAVARHLELKQPWRLGMAAMLSQLGNITIPPEISVKMSEGADLTDAEREIIDGTPVSARDLIANIPRLKPVADVVYLQNRGFDGSGLPKDGPVGTDIPLEARILKILVDLEARTRGTLSLREAFQSLFEREVAYDPVLLNDIRRCLETEKSLFENREVEEIKLPVSLLVSGYTLRSDLKLENGRLILGAGSRLSPAHVLKIKAFAKMHKFREPVEVTRNRPTYGDFRHMREKGNDPR